MPPEAIHAIRDLLAGVIAATTIVLVAYSPIAKGIGNRILHGKVPLPGAPPRDDARVDQISGEMAAMRQHLDETLERLDFAERMLAQQRDRPALQTGKDD